MSYSLTKGQQIIRSNPYVAESSTPIVKEFKQRFAEMIDDLMESDKNYKKDERLKDEAIKQIEQASMWVTKYLTS